MPLFKVGQVVATPAAIRVCELAEVNPLSLLAKHAYGDYGILSSDDVKSNEDAVAYGDRILSKYKVGKEHLYVITEADRSSTCIMLVQEY
jgi:hypothetical protein